MLSTRRDEVNLRAVALVGCAAMAPAAWTLVATGAATPISRSQVGIGLVVGFLVALGVASRWVRSAPHRGSRLVPIAGLVSGVALFAATYLTGPVGMALVAVSGLAVVTVAAAGDGEDRTITVAARCAVVGGLAWGVLTVVAADGDEDVASIMLRITVVALTVLSAAALLLPDRADAEEGDEDVDLLTVTTRPRTVHVAMVGFALAGATLVAVVMTGRGLLADDHGSGSGLWVVAGLLVGVVLAQAALAAGGQDAPGAAARLSDPVTTTAAAGLGLAVGAVPSPPVAALGFALASAGALTTVCLLDALCRRPLPTAAHPVLAQLSTAVAFAGAFAGAALLAVFTGRYGATDALLAMAAVTIGCAALLRRVTVHVPADVEREEARIAQLRELDELHRSGRPTPRLECSGLTFSYGSLQVLFDVSLHIGDGEVVALLGPNGVGKTTTLRVLSGLGRPSTGLIRLDGQDIVGTPARHRVAMGLTQVVGQASFGSLSVVENLRMHAFLSEGTNEGVRHRVDAALAVFPRLLERRNQQASTLSGGERQMLALAKTLVQRPRVLLIDELSLGLAPVVVGGLVELVRRLRTVGVSVLVVEQSANVALNLADRAYFMEKGTIVMEGTTDDLAARPDLVASLMLGGERPEDEPADIEVDGSAVEQAVGGGVR